jgi:type IV secretion system T-DNA border endonuclease VirD2
MVSAPQAVIKIIRNGGTRTPKQIKAQWEYISKDGDVELKRPESAHGANLDQPQWSEASREWAEATGRYAAGQQGPSNIDMTTHIVVSFPPGTNVEDAEGAGREWAERMFRPLEQDNGLDQEDELDHDYEMYHAAHEQPTGQHAAPQNYNFITAFHTDREHPHLHIVVNRRGDAGGWLKISRRHPVLNYTNMRQELVDAAANHNIILDATSRAERGIADPAPTDAELRRRARVPIPIFPRDQTDRSVNSNSEGNLSYALDSAVDYRDFDHSEGDGSSLSSGSDGSDGDGARRGVSRGTAGSVQPDGRTQGIPTEIIINTGNGNAGSQSDTQDDENERKPAARNRDEQSTDRQRLRADAYDDSSDDDDDLPIDDQDYGDGVAKLPRRVHEAHLAEQAKAAQQRERVERNLADAARWRAENAQRQADMSAIAADGSGLVSGRAQAGIEMQGGQDSQAVASTRKRSQAEIEHDNLAVRAGDALETSETSPAAKRSRGGEAQSETDDMVTDSQPGENVSGNQEREPNEARRKRGRQNEEDNQSQDSNMVLDQDDHNQQEQVAPPRQRQRRDVPERTMVLRSDVEREKREREEAAMLLRSGTRVGIDRSSSDRDKRNNDRGPQR